MLPVPIPTTPHRKACQSSRAKRSEEDIIPFTISSSNMASRPAQARDLPLLAVTSGQLQGDRTAPPASPRPAIEEITEAQLLERRQAKRKRLSLLALLIILTVGDIVLGGILFDVYTEVYAQYLNIGTAFVYCVVSTGVLAWRGQLGELFGTITGAGGDGTRIRPPWYLLASIGLINGSANWFQSVAQPHTANLTQSLLFLLSVPLVMLLSFVFLRVPADPVRGTPRTRKTPSLFALAGAGLIVAGTIISACRGVINPDAGSGDNGVTTYWYSICLFVLAQLLLAFEKVFEEHTFCKWQALDPMVMFCITMWTQFLLYFPLLPTQTMSALGGLELHEVPLVLWDGVKCTFGVTSDYPKNRALPHCNFRTNTTLFCAYAAVDFSCYFCGLYVIQKMDASMNAIASAVALPLQQLVFCLPFLGKYKSNIFGSDFGALALVLLGFVLHLALSPEGRGERDNRGGRESARRGAGNGNKDGQMGAGSALHVYGSGNSRTRSAQEMPVAALVEQGGQRGRAGSI